MRERRIDPRLEVPLEAEVRLPDWEAWLPATLQNLSAGGAALLFEGEPPPESERLGVRFALPAEDGFPECPVEIAAELVRSWAEHEAGASSNHVLAVRFVDMDEGLFKRVQRFVYNRLTRNPTVKVELPPEKERIEFKRPIAVRFSRFGEFVNEVSENLSMTGMFIQTDQPRPPGSVFDLEFVLGDDFTLVQARAEVVWTRRVDGGLHRPRGMGVKFLNLDETSKKVIRRLVTNQRIEEEALGSLQAVGGGAPAPAPVQAPDPPPPTRTAATPADSGDGGPALEAQLLKTRTDNAALESGQARLEEELRAAREESTASAAELEKSQEALAELRQKLEESDASSGLLSTRLDELTAEREALLQELERSRRALQQSEDEATSVREEIEALAGNSENARDDLEQARAEADRLRAELEAELEAARSGEDEARAGLAEIEGALEAQREAAAALEEEVVEARKEGLAVRAQLEELEATCLDLDSELSRSREDGARLSDEAEERAAGLTRDLERAAESAEQLDRELQQARAAEADLRQAVAEASAGSQQLRADMEESAEAVRAATERQTDAEEAAADLESRCERLTEELRAAEAEQKQLAAKCEELEAEAETARAERDEARDRAAGAAAESELQEERTRAREEELLKELDLARQEAEAAAGVREPLNRPPTVPTYRSRRTRERTAARAALVAAGLVLGLLAPVAYRALVSKTEGVAWPAAVEAPTPASSASDRQSPLVSLPTTVEPAAAPATATASGAQPAGKAAEAVVDPGEIESAVRAWAAAWSNQSLESYLSSYSAAFEPLKGLSRADWEAQRRERVPAPEWIRLEVESLEVTVSGSGEATASFEQAYETPNYGDRVHKTLRLVREAGAWKIAAEESRPL